MLGPEDLKPGLPELCGFECHDSEAHILTENLGVKTMGEAGDSLTSREVCARAELHSWKLQGGVPALGRSLGILYSTHVDIEGIACATFCLPPTDPCRGKLAMQHTSLS